jgi:DNA-directed RNA polymerase specialized sigma24 family protein
MHLQLSKLFTRQHSYLNPRALALRRGSRHRFGSCSPATNTREHAVDREQADKPDTTNNRTTNALTALAAHAFETIDLVHDKHATKARRALSALKSAEERDTLIAKLMNPLWGLAWRLARPNHDLAEELRAHVLFQCELGHYNPTKGEFAAWARTVMTRQLITLLKSKKRAAGGDEHHPERVDTTHCSCNTDNADITRPFPAEDLKRILKWSPLKRAFLLARSLTWRKLSAEMWAAFVEAAGLAEPFPSSEYEDMNLAERNSYLAEAFNVPRNTIHVRWKRWSSQFLTLRFVRELATLRE